jgi:hypothetical protein
MRSLHARIEGRTQPSIKYETQINSAPLRQEAVNAEEIEKLAVQVNLNLWQLVLKLHAVLEAVPDEAPQVLVAAGVVLRMDEMAALRTAIEGMRP